MPTTAPTTITRAQHLAAQRHVERGDVDEARRVEAAAASPRTASSGSPWSARVQKLSKSRRPSGRKSEREPAERAEERGHVAADRPQERRQRTEQSFEHEPEVEPVVAAARPQRREVRALAARVSLIRADRPFVASTRGG